MQVFNFSKRLALFVGISMFLCLGMLQAEMPQRHILHPDYTEDYPNYVSLVWDGDYAYDVVDGTAVIAFYVKNNATTFHVPATLGGYPVAKIGFSNDYDPNGFELPILHSVNNITVDAGNQYFTAVNGVLFSKDMSVLYCYPASKSGSSYTIPNSVKYIYHKAFSECTKLTSVTIPSGVREIGIEAFEKCWFINSIVLPNTLEAVWEDALEDCTGLTSLNIPASVQWLEGGFCHGCTSLASITVDSSNPYYRSVNGVLYYQSYGDDWLVAYPPAKSGTSFSVPNGVTGIADHAFCKCRLTSCTLPSSLLYIEDAAFKHATSLSSITLPSQLEYIGHEAFKDTALSAITIPASVEYIGSEAFYDCPKLTKSKVTFLGDIPDNAENAFPQGYVVVPTLDDFEYVLDYVSNMSGDAWGIIITGYKGRGGQVTIPGSVKIFDEYYGENVTCNVLKIGMYAFENNKTITSLSLPNSLLEIDNFAFLSCSKLSTINIPASVLYIGMAAFSESGLTSISIPESVIQINEGVFANCPSLKTATLPAGIESIGPFAFYKTPLTSINLNGVQYIYEAAFADCLSLSSITLPDSLEYIDAYAFNNCESLGNITIPEYCNVSSTAFAGCTGMTAFSVHPDNEYLFSDNGILYRWIDGDHSSLHTYPAGKRDRSLTIPSNVIRIMDNAFSDCPYIQTITIPDSVEYIGDEAFDDCTSLTTLYIGNGVTGIGEDVFDGCDSLSTVHTDNEIIIEYLNTNLQGVTVVTTPRRLTVNGETINKTKGDYINVTAPNQPGCVFSYWLAEGINLNNLNSASLSFKMPANDVILTAIYRYTYNLKNGWNHIASTMNLDVNSCNKLQGLNAFKLNATTKACERIKNISAGEAIWVFSKNNQTIKLEGSFNKNWTLDLHSGWNMVGCPKTISADEWKQSAKYAWEWKNGKFNPVNNQLEQGKGYWLLK